MIIYQLTNKIIGMKYIGQTVRSVEVRIKQHINRSKNSKTYIGNAIYKYGIDNFYIEILANCSSREELNQKEIELIAKENSLYPNGYNLSAGGEGINPTPEVCKRMSEGQKGKKSGRKGKTYGPNIKLSEYMTSRKRGSYKKHVDHRSNLGSKRTQETKLKMSLAKLGKSNISICKKISVKDFITNNEFIFNSITQAAKTLNLSRTALNNVLVGKSNRTKHYTAKYISG